MQCLLNVIILVQDEEWRWIKKKLTIFPFEGENVIHHERIMTVKQVSIDYDDDEVYFYTFALCDNWLDICIKNTECWLGHTDPQNRCRSPIMLVVMSLCWWVGMYYGMFKYGDFQKASWTSLRELSISCILHLFGDAPSLNSIQITQNGVSHHRISLTPADNSWYFGVNSAFVMTQESAAEIQQTNQTKYPPIYV